MSRFVVFCRVLSRCRVFFGTQKCDMTCAKQASLGSRDTISSGFDRRWTQILAPGSNNGSRISDIGSRIPVWDMAIPMATQKEVLRVALLPGRSRASSIRAPQPGGVTKSRCQRSAKKSARKTSARRTEPDLHQSTILVKQIHSETDKRTRKGNGAPPSKGW